MNGRDPYHSVVLVMIINRFSCFFFVRQIYTSNEHVIVCRCHKIGIEQIERIKAIFAVRSSAGCVRNQFRLMGKYNIARGVGDHR